MKTRLFECSTVLGVATAVAVLERLRGEDRGAFRNVMLLSNHAPYPELQDVFVANEGLLADALTCFDLVLKLNDLIHPQQPGGWRYHASWLGHRALFLKALGAERVDELVLESIHVPPAWSLSHFFSEARICVYSDGLMVYSPTRNPLAVEVQKRITDVYYVSLIPGVTPLLLREARANYVELSANELDGVFPKKKASTAPAKIALFLGQAMASAEMISQHEEIALYERGITQLLALPGLEVQFKPHPSAPESLTRALVRRIAKKTEKPLHVLTDERVVEAAFATGDIALSASVFSTGLFTGLGLYEIPAFCTGTLACLEKLVPFENSNRIPLVAADALLPTLDELEKTQATHGGDAATNARRLMGFSKERIANFVRAQHAVGYYMQPELLAELRGEADAARRTNEIPHLDVYLKGFDALYGHETALSRALLKSMVLVGSHFLDARRSHKLQRDPLRFIQDSKAPAVQAIGRLHASLKRKESGHGGKGAHDAS